MVFRSLEVDGAYFDTLGNALLQLFILLTTANFPDIMMPAYRGSGFSALFFVVFLMVGLYFLLNLVLAVVYNAFKASFSLHPFPVSLHL